MRRAPVPYAIAYVTLAEGPTMMTNIVDCDLDGSRSARPSSSCSSRATAARRCRCSRRCDTIFLQKENTHGHARGNLAAHIGAEEWDVPRRPRRVLPADCPFRLGRSDPDPQFGARAGNDRPVPDQPDGADVRRDHRLQPDQDRCRGQPGRALGIRAELCRFRDPQRDLSGPARRQLRDPHAYRGRYRGRRARRGPVAALAMGDAVL